MAKKISSLLAMDLTVTQLKQKKQKQQQKKQKRSCHKSLGLSEIGSSATAPAIVGSSTTDTDTDIGSQSQVSVDHVSDSAGDHTQVKPPYSSTPLPSSIEEEIAIIRGKKFGQLSPSLKRLENKILGDQSNINLSKPAVTSVSSDETSNNFVSSESYDHGQAISVTQSVTYPLNNQQISDPWQVDSGIFQSLSSAAPENTQHNYDDYTVESFSLTQDSNSSSFPNNGSLKKSQAPFSPSSQDEVIDEGAQTNNDLDKQQVDADIDAITKHKPYLDQEQYGGHKNNRMFNKKEIPSNEEPKLDQLLPQEYYPDDEDAATFKLDAPKKKTAVKPNAMDQQSVELALKELEQDLDAVMGPEKQTSRESNEENPLKENNLPTQGTETQEEAAQKSEAMEVDESTQSHDIFEQMSMGMPYANTFNLGTIDLSNTFAEFDQALDAEEAQTQAKSIEETMNQEPAMANAHQSHQFIDPESLPEAEMFADIADITQAQSVYKQQAAQQIIQKQANELQALKQNDNTSLNNNHKLVPSEDSVNELPIDSQANTQPSLGSNTPNSTHQDTQKTEKKAIIQYHVPLLNAIEDMSPASTAAAMLVAWQHNKQPTTTEITNGDGIWHKYLMVLSAEGSDVISAWGLTPLSHSLDNKNLVDTLERNGPLLLLNKDGGVNIITGIDPGEQNELNIIAVDEQGHSTQQKVSISVITDKLNQLTIAHS